MMLKNSFVYLISTIISALIPFLLIPIFTRYLSAEQYGQIAMFSIFISATGGLLGLSVHGAANRRYYDNIDSHSLAIYNFNCILVLLLNVLAFILFLAIFSSFISEFLNIPSSWLYIGVVCAVCSVILNIRQGQWQIRNKVISYATLQILNAILTSSFSIILIVIYSCGSEGRVWGILISLIIVLLICMTTMIKDSLVRVSVDYGALRSIYRFGMPLIPHVCGMFLLASLDRLVINKYLGVDSAGIYMVAYSFGNALNLIFQSINKAYMPWLFENLSKESKETDIKVVKYSYLYFLFILLMNIISFLILPSLLSLYLGGDFQEIINFLPIIILGQSFNGMYLVVTNYIFYKKKNILLSSVTISSGILNFILLLLLVPRFGLYGAAVSFLFSVFLKFIFTWFVSCRIYPMPWLNLRLIVRGSKSVN
ncbi:lipopolysaccharide biosynthesis protein [Vibrio breoganii]